MTQKKEQDHYKEMARRAGMLFDEFPDSELALAVKDSHVECPLACIIDVIESVFSRLATHDNIHNAVKNEFYNDQKLYEMYKNLIVPDQRKE